MVHNSTVLRFLGVRHLAVIDKVEVEFRPGLNVLTGETGAGKSILVEAIDLLVGGRSTSDLVRTGEDLASVQAIFEDAHGRELVVRREVSAEGRSRAFLDDALATAAALRERGASLLSLHGQHEHRALMDPAEHVDLLDAYAAHVDLVLAVGQRYEAWRTAADALERSQLSDQEKRGRIDIASFQLHEIEKVAPQAGEDESLAAERQVLAHADRLSRLSEEAYVALYEGDAAALPSLALVWKRLSEIAALDARAQPFLDQRDDLKARLDDLAFFLRGYREAAGHAPDRLQKVEDRLAALDRLKKRYGPALPDVLARAATLKAELDELDASDDKLAQLAARERETREAFLTDAGALGRARRHAAAKLERDLEKELAALAMATCRLDVRVAASDRPEDATPRGMDQVEFFFSPNPGEDVRPLARIASGGELSRFMLALRLLTMRAREGTTLIFDEVDAGIGGSAADAVATRLQALGRRHQVLCVTHLAQVAARADAHFEITKQVRNGRTHTAVRRLDGPEREREVARMIAGASITASVLASARELIGSGRRSEEKTNRQKGVRRGA